MKKQFVLMAAIVAVLSIGLVVQDANAMSISQIRLSDAQSATDVTIKDGDAGDASGLSGVIRINEILGNWSIISAIGSTKPQSGDSLSPDMNLAAFTVSNFSTNNETLSIEFTDVDFVDSSLQGLMVGDMSYLWRTSGNVTANVWADFGNTPFGKGTLISSVGPLGTSGGMQSFNYDPTGTNPYSLTIELEIAHDSPGVTAGFVNVQAEPVPEPTTIILLGIGLAGIAGGAARRKWKKKVN